MSPLLAQQNRASLLSLALESSQEPAMMKLSRSLFTVYRGCSHSLCGHIHSSLKAAGSCIRQQAEPACCSVYRVSVQPLGSSQQSSQPHSLAACPTHRDNLPGASQQPG